MAQNLLVLGSALHLPDRRVTARLVVLDVGAAWTFAELKEGEPIMNIALTEEEARTLRQFLHDHLPELRLEVARTDARDMRHVLSKRVELCERILGELERGTG